MKTIRKIAFLNDAGDRFGLNGEQGVFATNLSGFGFSLDPVFPDTGHGFYEPVSEDNEVQAPIAFTLVFTKSPYETYRRLINWLAASSKMTLLYNPDGSQEFRRDIYIHDVQKGELNAMGWLEAPCSMKSITPWYNPTPAVLALSAGLAAREKRYDYRYTPTLRYGSDDVFSWTSYIEGTGHIPGSLEISFAGELVHPRIKLVGSHSGRVYGVCRVASDFSATDSLMYSSRYDGSFVKKVSADGVETDLLDVLDLTTTPFMRVPVDEPCIVSIASDAPLAGIASLLAYYYYRSV